MRRFVRDHRISGAVYDLYVIPVDYIRKAREIGHIESVHIVKYYEYFGPIGFTRPEPDFQQINELGHFVV